jgi:N-acetylmuramoyl-L-alanine amidase
MRRKLMLTLLVLFVLSTNAGAAGKGLTIKTVRSSSYALFTRIVFEVEAAAPYVLTRSQDGRSMTLGSYEGPFILQSPLPKVRDGVIAGVEAHEENGRAFVVVRLDPIAGEVKDFTLRGPDRIVIDIAKGGLPPVSVQSKDRMIVIVLDPGHGGKDSGLLTGQGLEKMLDLELALAIRKLLEKTKRFTVVLTRDRDVALPLDDRAAIANGAGASVFVSIHAAAGEAGHVYVQDLTDDTGVSAPPPPMSDFLGYESGSGQQALAWGKQQAVHVQQSGELGRKLARQLAGNTSADPVQAPLAGLKAVDAAAVMIEIDMARDRVRIAEEVAKGIEQYVVDNR